MSEDIFNPLAFKSIVKEAVRELISEGQVRLDEEDALAKINRKDNISVGEGALLLGCSASHLYKKVDEARRGKSKNPIPYLDIDGVYSLPRQSLLKWATPKKLRAA